MAPGSEASIVQHDVVHSFDCSGAMGAMLFVDPESSEGMWLHRALEQEIVVVPDAMLASSVSGIAHLRRTAD